MSAAATLPDDTAGDGDAVTRGLLRFVSIPLLEEQLRCATNVVINSNEAKRFKWRGKGIRFTIYDLRFTIDYSPFTAFARSSHPAI